MSIKAYAENTAKDQKIVESILSHMLTYKNTSIKKTDRIESARAAKQLIEYIITVYETSGADYVLIQGLMKINTRLTECIMSPNELFDIDNELGFMRIFLDICDKSKN